MYRVQSKITPLFSSTIMIQYMFNIQSPIVPIQIRHKNGSTTNVFMYEQYHNNTAQHAFFFLNILIMVVVNGHLTQNKQQVINNPTTVIKLIL